MNVVEVPLGEWLPDQPSLNNPGLMEADNVYPIDGGYGPFRTPALSDDTVTGNVIGARMFYRNNGNTLIVGGTATTLFTYTGGTVTATNPPYTTTANWRFERFNDLIVAVSKENATQYLTDLDTDTSFSDLPGSPPKAAVLGRVNDFLVLGNTDDGTDVPNRLWWSAFNNPTTTWAVDPGELSGFQDLDPKYGKITGIVGGRWGLVFQERAIWRMTFVGSPKVFDIVPVATDRGCVAPDSIVTIGYQTFFLARGGICVTNGSEVEWLGSARHNKWLEATMDSARQDETQGAVDWPSRCIVWSIRTQGQAAYRKQLIYNFTLDRFSTASQTVDWLVSSNQDALTIGDLATLFPSGLGTMSAYEIGTSEWQARDQIFACFVDTGSTSAFATFAGPSAEAYLSTGDYSPTPGRRTRVLGLRPIAEYYAGGMFGRIVSRWGQGGNYSSADWNTRAEDGFIPANKDNWFHSLRLKFSAGAQWDRATGFWVKAKTTGVR